MKDLNTTIIITSFNTADLLETCYRSLSKFYPTIPIIIVENGSTDKSREMTANWDRKCDYTTVVQLVRNIGHGPGMHLGILQAMTKYVFTLDTDCTVNKRGFLELMTKAARAHDLYAIGWMRWTNNSGVAARKPDKATKANLLPYIHPSAALWDRDKYLELPSFRHTGAPCTCNMQAARKREFGLEDFPIQNYITHDGSGTRRLYRGRWNPGDEPPNPKPSTRKFAL